MELSDDYEVKIKDEMVVELEKSDGKLLELGSLTLRMDPELVVEASLMSNPRDTVKEVAYRYPQIFEIKTGHQGKYFVELIA